MYLGSYLLFFSTRLQITEKKKKWISIKGNLFDIDKGKKIISFGVTSKNINQFLVKEKAVLKDGSELTVSENGNYLWKSQNPFNNKKGKRIFVTASSPPNFTLENYKEVLFKEGVGQAFLNTLTVGIQFI